MNFKKNFFKDSFVVFLFCFSLYFFFVATNGDLFNLQILFFGFGIFVVCLIILISILLYFLYKFNEKLIPCLFLIITAVILFFRFFRSSPLLALGISYNTFWFIVFGLVFLLCFLAALIGYKLQRKIIPFIIIFLLSIIGSNFTNLLDNLKSETLSLKEIENYYKSFSGKANFKIRPNIYHIMLDTYPSNQIWKKIYQIDNSKFYKELSKRKFKIYRTAYSPGRNTLSSMNIIFNMKVIREDFSYKGRFTDDDYRIVRKSPVIGLLIGGGYTVSCYTPCMQSKAPISKKFIFLENRKKFQTKNLIEQYLNFYFNLPLVYRVLNPEGLKKSTGKVFQYYKKIETIKTPALFYIQDYTFPYKKEDLVSLNTITLKFLDDIITSDPESIILLHSDHGSRGKRVTYHHSKNYVETPEELFGVLQAVKFPKQCERFNQVEVLGQVNFYRYVFACLRGEEKPKHLEPANSYALKNGKIYKFIENWKILEQPIKIEE